MLRIFIVVLASIIALTTHGGTVPCSAVVNGDTTHLNLAAYADALGTVSINNCQWEDAVVQLTLSGRLYVRISNVIVTRGSVSVATSPPGSTGSRLEVVDVAAAGCSDCFSASSSSEVRGLSMDFLRCTLHGTQSAASLLAPIVTDCSIALHDSTIVVDSSMAVTAAASVLPDATGTLQVSGTSITCTRSNVTSRSSVGAAASLALVVCTTSSRAVLSAFNVTIRVTNSAVNSTGVNCVASAGLASYGTSSHTTLEASSSSTIGASLCTLYSESSTISASGSGSAIASMGIASYNYCASSMWIASTIIVSSTSNISAADVDIHGHLTQCTASGADSIASMGVASRATAACTNTKDPLRCAVNPTSSVTARSVIIDVGPSSSASASGESSVSSAAFTSHAGTSTVELTEITIRGGAASSPDSFCHAGCGREWWSGVRRYNLRVFRCARPCCGGGWVPGASDWGQLGG